MGSCWWDDHHLHINVKRKLRRLCDPTWWSLCRLTTSLYLEIRGENEHTWCTHINSICSHILQYFNCFLLSAQILFVLFPHYGFMVSPRLKFLLSLDTREKVMRMPSPHTKTFWAVDFLAVWFLSDSTHVLRLSLCKIHHYKHSFVPLLVKFVFKFMQKEK